MDESLFIALGAVVEWLEHHGYRYLAYLDNWLAQFAEALEQPEIVAQYQAIQARIAAANGGGNPLN